MFLSIEDLKNLIAEKWTANSEQHDYLLVVSGEHVILKINHSQLKEEEIKQIARCQLLASAPDMAKALSDIIDTSLNIVVDSQDENAIAAFHEGYYALRKVMGRSK